MRGQRPSHAELMNLLNSVAISVFGACMISESESKDDAEAKL